MGLASNIILLNEYINPARVFCCIYKFEKAFTELNNTLRVQSSSNENKSQLQLAHSAPIWILLLLVGHLVAERRLDLGRQNYI